MSAYIHGFGSFLPSRIVPNDEIAARLGRTSEWIENVSGIRERRWADSDTGVVEMGVAAAQDCLEKTGVSASSIGLLVVASGSAARGFPGPAAEIATRLEMGGAPALDLPLASAGSLFGLALAKDLVASCGEILVVAAEKMSAIVDTDPLDPNTAILFGDGAGAALVSSRPGKWKIRDAVLHSDGQYTKELGWDSGPLRMNGLTVILQAGRKIPGAIEEILLRQNVAAQDVAAFLLHQANLNLLMRVAKTLKVSEEKVFLNVQHYGNTSSASLLIAADEWASNNPPAGPVVFSAFGAGFHWGALLAETVS